MSAALFGLVRVVVTPGAIDALTDAFKGNAGATASELLHRHQAGDFGDLSTDDWFANMKALLDGSRILSAYRLPVDTDACDEPARLWIITEGANDDDVREYTTILLPEEY